MALPCSLDYDPHIDGLLDGGLEIVAPQKFKGQAPWQTDRPLHPLPPQ